MKEFLEYVDYVEHYGENRLKYLADNYNFDMDCEKDAIKSAWEFAKQDNYEGYEFNVKQVGFWETMADFWREQGRREHVYVLED